MLTALTEKIRIHLRNAFVSSPTYDEILRTAQSLTESERIQLGEALLSSMEPI